MLPFRRTRASAPRPADTTAPPAAAAPCANCGDTTPGAYCPSCGQARRLTLVSLNEMLVDFLDDQLSLNSRLPRTVAALLVRPGFLTQEYLRGRIASYIRPLRLYLGASVTFFLLLSVLDSGWLQVGEDPSTSPVPEIPADAPLSPEQRQQIATAQRTATALQAAAPELVGGKSWVDEIELQTSSPALNRLVEEKKAHFRGMTPGEAVRQVGGEFREHVPTMMFLLLPVFALLLKLFYAGRKRLYVEHFVFALHLHAFAFAAFSVMLVARHEMVSLGLGLWVLVYTFLSMRRVYGEPLLRTGVKYVALGWSYSFVLSLAVAVTAVVTVLLV